MYTELDWDRCAVSFRLSNWAYGYCYVCLRSFEQTALEGDRFK